MTKSPESIITLPAWLDAVRQPDEEQAAAYEACPSDFRASLKTAIAFAFHLWGESASSFATRLENSHSGFVHTLSCRPAAWTLALLSPNYISPARFIAAILPAILAGVSKILITSLGTAPSPALCAATELAGLEDIFILPSGTDDVPRLLRELYAQNSDGRVLLFPSVAREEPGFSIARQTAGILKLHLWQDNPAPRLSIIPSALPSADENEAGEKNGNVLRRDIITWAHGDAQILDRDECGITARFVQDYAEGFTDAPDTYSPLCFGPGLETCWVHPLLKPEYFRTRTLRAYFSHS